MTLIQSQLKHEITFGAPLTLKQGCLLNLMLDFMLDPSVQLTLGQALLNGDPLSVLRMLGQQWNLGLTTLSGDLQHKHSAHLQPAVAAKFVEGIGEALRTDVELRQLTQDNQRAYKEMLRYMARNQHFHAAWCAILVWERPSTLN